jgi:hypothetical protein
MKLLDPQWKEEMNKFQKRSAMKNEKHLNKPIFK